jgi:hypothetical protein
MIEIKLVGPKGLQKLSSLPEAISNSLLKGMADGAMLIERTSKDKYLSGPYPGRLTSDSGALKSGISAIAGLTNEPGEIGRIKVRSTTWYGKVHEQMGYSEEASWSAIMGHIGVPFTGFRIFAKTPKGMSFFWKRRGVQVYGARMVTIPARPFLYPAILDNLEKIRLLLNRMIRQGFQTAKAK